MVMTASASSGHTGRHSNDDICGIPSVLIGAENSRVIASPLRGLYEYNISVYRALQSIQTSRRDDRTECEEPLHDGITASPQVATAAPTVCIHSPEEDVSFDTETISSFASQPDGLRAGGECRAMVYVAHSRQFDDPPTGIPPRSYAALAVPFRIPRGLLGSRPEVEEAVWRDGHSGRRVDTSEVRNTSREGISDAAGRHLPRQSCSTRGDAGSSTSASGNSESSFAVVVSSPVRGTEIGITRLTPDAIPTRLYNSLLLAGGGPTTFQDSTTMILSEDIRAARDDDTIVLFAVSSSRPEVSTGRLSPPDPIVPASGKVVHGGHLGTHEDACSNEGEELVREDARRGRIFPVLKGGSVDGDQRVQSVGECRGVVEGTRSVAVTGIDNKDVQGNDGGFTTPPRLKRVRETYDSSTLLEINPPLVGSLLYNANSLPRKEKQEGLRLGGAGAEISLDEKDTPASTMTVTRPREIQQTQSSQRQSLLKPCAISPPERGTTAEISRPTTGLKLVATRASVDGDDALTTSSACQSNPFLVAAALTTVTTPQPRPVLGKVPQDTNVEDARENSRRMGLSTVRADVENDARPPAFRTFASERSEVEISRVPPPETTSNARQAIARRTEVVVREELVPSETNDTTSSPLTPLPVPLSKGKSFNSHRDLNYIPRTQGSSASASSPLDSSIAPAQSTVMISCCARDKDSTLSVSSERLGLDSGRARAEISAMGNATQTDSPHHGSVSVRAEATNDDCNGVGGTKRTYTIGRRVTRDTSIAGRPTASGEGWRGRSGSELSVDIAVRECHCALETVTAEPVNLGQLDPGVSAGTNFLLEDARTHANVETTTARRGDSDNSSRITPAYPHDAGANNSHPEETVVSSGEEVTRNLIGTHRPRWDGSLLVAKCHGGDTGRVLANAGHGGKALIHATPSVNGIPLSSSVCSSSYRIKRASDSPPSLSQTQSAWLHPSEHPALSEVITRDKVCDMTPTEVPPSANDAPIAISERPKSHSTTFLLGGLPESSPFYSSPSTTPLPPALFRPPTQLSGTDDADNFESRSMEASVCSARSDEDQGHIESPPRLAEGRWCERWERRQPIQPCPDAAENDDVVGQPHSGKHT